MTHARRTDRILEELQRLKALDRTAVVEEEKTKFVVFTLDEGRYAFAGAEVKEILAATEIFPVPGAPAAVSGVINNRGDIEAVVDLRGILGLAAGSAAAGRIVMTEKEGLRAGMLVDAVVDVVDVPPSAIRPPLATLAEAARELVTGEMDCQGRSVVLLDVGGILEAMRRHER